MIHSARWDHDSTSRGKRVAIVGTGASAVQIVPAIAREVARLDVYQRTPIWVAPKFDPQIPRAGQAAVPRACRSCSDRIRGPRQRDRSKFVLVVARRQLRPLRPHHAAGRLAERATLWYRLQVRDPELRAG